MRFVARFAHAHGVGAGSHVEETVHAIVVIVGGHGLHHGARRIEQFHLSAIHGKVIVAIAVGVAAVATGFGSVANIANHTALDAGGVALRIFHIGTSQLPSEKTVVHVALHTQCFGAIVVEPGFHQIAHLGVGAEHTEVPSIEGIVVERTRRAVGHVGEFVHIVLLGSG